jgi:sporulation protein YunB
VRAARSAVNELLADSTRAYVREQGIASEDFYSLSQSEGMLSSLEVNTLLVNDICAEIADKVSFGLSELGEQELTRPAGTLGGWNFLAGRGPLVGVKIQPRGSVMVDYGSDFVSAGINQINFQIWLDVRAEVNVVSIRRESPIVVERRIPLVNTVFSGDTPDTYFKLDGKSDGGQ